MTKLAIAEAAAVVAAELFVPTKKNWMCSPTTEDIASVSSVRWPTIEGCVGCTLCQHYHCCGLCVIEAIGRLWDGTRRGDLMTCVVNGALFGVRSRRAPFGDGQRRIRRIWGKENRDYRGADSPGVHPIYLSFDRLIGRIVWPWLFYCSSWNEQNTTEVKPKLDGWKPSSF